MPPPPFPYIYQRCSPVSRATRFPYVPRGRGNVFLLFFPGLEPNFAFPKRSIPLFLTRRGFLYSNIAAVFFLPPFWLLEPLDRSRVCSFSLFSVSYGGIEEFFFLIALFSFPFPQPKGPEMQDQSGVPSSSLVLFRCATQQIRDVGGPPSFFPSYSLLLFLISFSFFVWAHIADLFCASESRVCCWSPPPPPLNFRAFGAGISSFLPLFSRPDHFAWEFRDAVCPSYSRRCYHSVLSQQDAAGHRLFFFSKWLSLLQPAPVMAKIFSPFLVLARTFPR